MRTWAWTALLGLCLSALSPASTVAAQAGADRDEARALFVAGSAAVEAGRWADAVASFERAYELTNAPSALYNLALALRALGRHRESRDAFDRLLREHELTDPEIQREAQSMRDDEAARVATLELLGLEEASRYSLRFDGREVADEGARPMRIEADGGAHTLVAELDGYERFLWEGQLVDGGRETLRVFMTPLGTSQSGDDTALHVVLIVSLVAILAAGGAVLGYFVWEGQQIAPLYPQRVDL